MKKSIIYKLIVKGVIVHEGNKKQMHKLKNEIEGSFVGIGSPLPSIGKKWGFA